MIPFQAVRYWNLRRAGFDTACWRSYFSFGWRSSISLLLQSLIWRTEVQLTARSHGVAFLPLSCMSPQLQQPHLLALSFAQSPRSAETRRWQINRIWTCSRRTRPGIRRADDLGPGKHSDGPCAVSPRQCLRYKGTPIDPYSEFSQRGAHRCHVFTYVPISVGRSSSIATNRLAN